MLEFEEHEGSKQNAVQTREGEGRERGNEKNETKRELEPRKSSSCAKGKRLTLLLLFASAVLRKRKKGTAPCRAVAEKDRAKIKEIAPPPALSPKNKTHPLLAPNSKTPLGGLSFSAAPSPTPSLSESNRAEESTKASSLCCAVRRVSLPSNLLTTFFERITKKILFTSVSRKSCSTTTEPTKPMPPVIRTSVCESNVLSIEGEY